MPLPCFYPTIGLAPDGKVLLCCKPEPPEPTACQKALPLDFTIATTDPDYPCWQNNGTIDPEGTFCCGTIFRDPDKISSILPYGDPYTPAMGDGYECRMTWTFPAWPNPGGVFIASPELINFYTIDDMQVTVDRVYGGPFHGRFNIALIDQFNSQTFAVDGMTLSAKTIYVDHLQVKSGADTYSESFKFDEEQLLFTSPRTGDLTTTLHTTLIDVGWSNPAPGILDNPLAHRFELSLYP